VRNPTRRERASITTAGYSAPLAVLKIPKVDGGFPRVALPSRWPCDSESNSLARLCPTKCLVDFLVTFIDLGYQTP
jgi:hypothetical protein